VGANWAIKRSEAPTLSELSAATMSFSLNHHPEYNSLTLSPDEAISGFDPYKEVGSCSPPEGKESRIERQGSQTFLLRWIVKLAIWGGLFAGIMVAVGNHFFFNHLSGTRTDVVPQFWVTAAKNVFPNAVQIALGISLTSSMTQAVRISAHWSLLNRPSISY
jgi:hypothetical protein